MKVYIVIEDFDYEGHREIAAFSSLTAALAWIEAQPDKGVIVPRYGVIAMMIDAPDAPVETVA